MVLAALTTSVAGCTGSAGSPGPHSPAASSPAVTGPATPGTPAASICSRKQITAAIRDFFGTWNHRDAPALGRLFAADGELDLTTKHQHAAGGSDAWSSARDRMQIAAFARRQWHLGEELSHRGIQTIVNGGASGDGGYVSHVEARFGDSTVQPMGYAKFIYSCASRAFVHVVIVSARAASSA